MNTIREMTTPIKTPIIDENNEYQHYHERNNSLPDVFGCEEFNESWEKFWGFNGERLIWSSWIEKYSDFINPNFKEFQMTTTTTTNNETPLLQTENFSFDEHDINSVLDNPPCNTEIIVSSCSPAAYSVVNTPTTSARMKNNNLFEDGWNPLSPDSVNGTTDTIPMIQSSDNENLLSPRCESVTSSIPFTIGTTDSMTNVTRMTMSDYDFCSGKISSENSDISSDIQTSSSSSTASSSQYDDIDGGPLTVIEDETTMDPDQYWQILWQKHFQEQYAKHFKIFMDTNELLKTSNLCSSIKSENGSDITDKLNLSNKIKTNKRKRNRKTMHENLPKLIANLKLKNEITIGCGIISDDIKMRSIPNSDGNGDDKKKSEPEKQQTETTTSNEKKIPQEYIEMAAMGLPISFGSKPSGSGGSGGGGDKPPNDKPINLKRR